MSVPYAVNQGNLRTEIEEYSNVYYVSGQGGIIVTSQYMQAVVKAAVLDFYTGTGTIVYSAAVVSAGLNVGTLPNAIKVFVNEIVGGSVTEAPTGTIAGTLRILVVGN